MSRWRRGLGHGDARLDAAAFHRNIDPILSVFSEWLQGLAGDALEVGSGSGQHVVAFAQAFPDLQWWPSDPDPDNLASVDAWAAAAQLTNLRNATQLDASADDWQLGQPQLPPARLAAIACLNVLHISPWTVAEGLFAGAARHLEAGGVLALYGPYIQPGVDTAPSNLAFDANLRARDPRWGLRHLADVSACAEASGLQLEQVQPMPANNLSLLFRR